MARFVVKVEEALPPFVILWAQLKMERLGYPQTPGVKHAFAHALSVAMADVAVNQRGVIRCVLGDTTTAMTRDLRPDDPRDILLASLAFMSVLAENGLYRPLQDRLPRLALQEIRDFSALGQWKINDAWVLTTAQTMLMRARLAGYYLREGDRS